MGMQETPETIPDTSNLPEFFISEVMTEIDGGNVRVVCGVKRGGRMHWLYSAVMPADALLLAARQCFSAAQEAHSLMKLKEWSPQPRHH